MTMEMNMIARKSIFRAVGKLALRRGAVKRLRLPILVALLAVIGSLGTFSFSLAAIDTNWPVRPKKQRSVLPDDGIW